MISFSVIFKVYDSDCNGKVSFNDILEVLRDLSGSFMSDEQREVISRFYPFSRFLWSFSHNIAREELMVLIDSHLIGVCWVLYSNYQLVTHELCSEYHQVINTLVWCRNWKFLSLLLWLHRVIFGVIANFESAFLISSANPSNVFRLVISDKFEHCCSISDLWSGMHVWLHMWVWV